MSTRPRPPTPTDLRPSRERDRIDPAVLGAAGEPSASPARAKLRKIGKWVGIFVLVVLTWTAWAVYAVHDLADALQNLDPVALERRVDWVAVQQGLREDLTARSLSANAAARPSVVQLMRTAKLDGTASAEPRFWGRVASLAYSGGPFALRVDLKPDGEPAGPPITLLFKWSGDWRLARVFLPGEAAGTPAPAAQNTNPGSVFPPAPASAPAPTPPPAAASAASAGSAKAVLFEEDPKDPAGKRHDGTVTWQIEQKPAAAGGPPELAVRADVSVPTRPLAMTLWFRRNADKTLPASHTIEVKFELPADSTTGGIQDVPGIMLKQGEEARGTRLAGISVNVSSNFFLIGLSAIELDIEHNIRLLRDRSWFDIPIAYKSKVRAVLALEKGSVGEKAITDALAQWAAAPADKDSQKK